MLVVWVLGVWGRSRAALRVACIAIVAGAGLLGAASVASASTSVPPIRHVFVIIDENESESTTFGPGSAAPYLSQTLVSEGAYLSQYYGIGHNSLDNYIAMVSGQAPNPETSSDCQTFSDFISPSLDANGQETGSGCVYPSNVPTLMSQLDGAGLTWRAYEDSMGSDPNRESATCGHPQVDQTDTTQAGEVTTCSSPPMAAPTNLPRGCTTCARTRTLRFRSVVSAAEARRGSSTHRTPAMGACGSSSTRATMTATAPTNGRRQGRYR